MTIDLEVLFPVLLYICLIILVIFLIGLVIKFIKVLNKVDSVLDECNRKLIQLDGLFELIDSTTDYAADLKNKVIASFNNCFKSLFGHKRRRDEDE